MLVHAAAFPAFRLCFENQKDRQPQPDTKVMPEANVVGVEVGSVVRIDPITTAPGKVYVIDERVVQNTLGSKGVTCGDLICTGKTTCLRANLDYHTADTLVQPLGITQVEVVAVTGCGNAAFLGELGLQSSDCGAGWDTTKGNLLVKTLALKPRTDAKTNAIPAQVLNVSAIADKVKGASDLTVTFGKIGDATVTDVARNPPLYATSADTDLTVDQTDEKVYAQMGFNVAIAGSPNFTVTQSLADVQALSAPRDVPSVYYKAASNYVLLLLGDPRIAPKLDDGGPNGGYDSRRGVHLLAVPILDPSKVAADGGAEGGDGGP
jgi:hypothetical protein